MTALPFLPIGGASKIPERGILVKNSVSIISESPKTVVGRVSGTKNLIFTSFTSTKQPQYQRTSKNIQPHLPHFVTPSNEVNEVYSYSARLIATEVVLFFVNEVKMRFVCCPFVFLRGLRGENQRRSRRDRPTFLATGH